MTAQMAMDIMSNNRFRLLRSIRRSSKSSKWFVIDTPRLFTIAPPHIIRSSTLNSSQGGMYIRGATKIGLVAPVKPSHPYLESDPSLLLDLHYLRISPWLWFSNC